MLESYTAKLVTKNSVTPDIFILTFEADRPVTFVAGQYLILHVPTENGEYARRLYSMANAPQGNRIELVVKRITGGIGTKYVEAMEAGATIQFQAPAGLFTLRPDGRNVVMLATNTGIAPYRSMIHDELNKGPLKHEMHLFWGMRTRGELYYGDEFAALTKQDPKFAFTPCLSRDQTDHDGAIAGRIDTVFTSHILPQFKDNLASYDFYLCGGVGFIDALREKLAEAGVVKECIYFEKFV